MFIADIKQWKSVPEFQQHLLSLPKPDWVKGIVFHHTWKPVQSDWRGRTSMESLKRYYEKMGWTAGPHLFVCLGSPNPADDGIWQLTPLNAVGIHAGECNSSTWGVEIVGNFDIAPWPLELKAFNYELFAALLRKINVTSVNLTALRGHRECNSPKTCPGKMINTDAVRDDMQRLLFPSNPVVTRDSTIIAAPRCTQEEAVAYLKNRGGWYTDNELKNIIVPAYFQECDIAKVDPCVAIAQMIHETGFLTSWWSNRPRRNPAGIGVTGQMSNKQPPPEDIQNWAYDEKIKKWRKGLSFTAWDKTAVPAHIARLLGYALKPEEQSTVQKAYVAKYTEERPLPPKVIGCAPTLAGLEGTWAYPGKGYADKLALQANNIIRL